MQAVSVSDGDTFTVRDAGGARVGVRLLGIDASDTARDDQAAQCGADHSTEALRQLNR